MLYTRNGDEGVTDLFAAKDRLSKDSAVFEALGALDECNSLLGICRVRAESLSDQINISEIILGVQECLFIIQGEIAGAEKILSVTEIKKLENIIDNVEALIIKPRSFVIPGATEFSALCDFARTVSRRAERRVVTITMTRNISAQSLAYVNRISSLLYAFARYGASIKGVKEQAPSY